VGGGELGAGVDAELVGERGAELVEDRQGVGAAAGRVQGAGQ